MSDPTFTFDEKKVPVRITVPMAMTELPKLFDIKIIGMFASDEQVIAAMRELVLDDDKALRLMHFFIEKHTSMSFESMIEKMKNLDVVDEFREAFWAAVVNFSGPLKKQIILDMWTEFKKELKEFDLAQKLSGA